MAGEYADMKLWLSAPLDVRADRIATRENERSNRRRPKPAAWRQRGPALRDFYDIDFDDLSIYDLSGNTARWDPQGVLSVTLHAVESYSPDGDEGKAPVENIRYEF